MQRKQEEIHKGKMGDRKEAENETSSKSKWPLVKHKKNLQITRLKENDLFIVAPAEGMALPHIHGDECMLHEARNITKGREYIFRSDVCFA